MGDSITALFTTNVPIKGKYTVGINEQSSGDGIRKTGDIFMGHYDIVITKVKDGIKTITYDSLYLDWDEEETYIVNF